MTKVQAHLIEGGIVTGHQIKGGDVKQTITAGEGVEEVSFDLLPDLHLRHGTGVDAYARLVLGELLIGAVPRGKPGIFPEIFVDKKGSTDENEWVHYHARLDHMAR